MSAVVQLRPDADTLLEQAIDLTFHRWLDGEAEWPELVSLINARSPEQVTRMEKERGLV